MDDRVRPATLADTAELAVLEAAARAALVELRGGPALLAEQPPVADWASVLERDAGLVVVATIDDIVVGYLELAVGDGPQGRTATVRQAYVEPGARELGFGSDMMDLAIAAAGEQGCVVIEGASLPGDRDTKNLYERAGITARKIITSRRLA